MNKVNNFLDMMGFQDFNDFIGVTTSPKPVLAIYSLTLGGIGAFVEVWTGISLYFWLFLTLATVFDIIFGIYANIFILRNEFESRRFFRGIFKSFVVLLIIVVTNSLNLGVKHSQINPEVLKTTFSYMASAIHYSFVMLISLYLLSGISENGAKIDIPVFKSLSKLLKIKINKIENLGEDIEVVDEEQLN